jgi:hypothetical protein
MGVVTLGVGNAAAATLGFGRMGNARVVFAKGRRNAWCWTIGIATLGVDRRAPRL